MSQPSIHNQGANDSPQIKICGLTRVDEATGCVQRGADAIGFVFFHKSPRCVTPVQAADIIRALPVHVKKVGVFVNESYTDIMRIAEACGLNAVQLHGQEPPKLVQRLHRQKLLVIKALFSARAPGMDTVVNYDADAFLVECGKGVLPGGNAEQWNWAEVNLFAQRHPCILAGGLAPENIEDAICAGSPDAVDVSSGVESEPGRKDLSRVEQFIQAVNRCRINNHIRRIF